MGVEGVWFLYKEEGKGKPFESRLSDDEKAPRERFRV